MNSARENAGNAIGAAANKAFDAVIPDIDQVIEPRIEKMKMKKLDIILVFMIFVLFVVSIITNNVVFLLSTVILILIGWLRTTLRWLSRKNKSFK